MLVYLVCKYSVCVNNQLSKLFLNSKVVSNDTITAKGTSSRTKQLNGHFHANLRIGFVILDFKVLKCKVVNFGYISFNFEGWEWSWLTLELFLKGFNVVQVDMCVTGGMDEISRL